MVKSCLVATCKNTLGKSGITFHMIGKKRYADRLKAIGRNVEDCLSPQNVVCSQHYAEDDFIFFNGKKYLKLEAMPRFFIPRKPDITKPTETKSCLSHPPLDKPQNSTDTNVADVLSEDTWLMYTDLWIFTTHDDKTETIINQDNLS